MSASPESSHDILFFTRPSCHLCDEAWPWVNEIAKRHHLKVTKVYIQDDQELTLKHGERIPVLEYRGNEIGWGRLDPKTVERKLKECL